MPTTPATLILKAGEKLRRAERRVSDCRRALAMAERASARAGSEYVELVRKTLPTAHTPASAGEEVASNAA
jgi:hypothetical protein